MADEAATLEFLARQQMRILEELAAARDERTRIRDDIARTHEDLAVMAAMVQRLDGTMRGLVNEVRAEHARYARLERRLAKLEESP